jgi:glycosyltransferase involved in cell wall biosynthesis
LYSGFETAITEIGRRLVARGHDVTVYCRTGYGNASEPTFEGIKKKYLPRIRLKVADTLSHSFLAFLHQLIHPADVIVVVNSANGPLCVLPRLRGIPFAINVDGLEWERAKWPWIGRKYFYFAGWVCTKLAPAIIADSRGIQDYYRNKWGCDSFYASYGAHIERSSHPEILDAYGLKPNEYFLVVARLEPENSTKLLVDAFAGVRTSKQLVIVGDTNYRSKYVQSLKAGCSDERVRFLGGIYDPPEHLTEIMCNCFAYVHGHTVGGTNPVLLKALGCGACVLYADVSFNAEVVKDAGIPFALDVAKARAVFQSVEDRPEVVARFRTMGRSRIDDEYNWEEVTDRYEELCLRLVEGKEIGNRKKEIGNRK